MTVFDRVWAILKGDDDEIPQNWDEEAPLPGPAGFFQNLRNNPKIMDFIGEQGENLAAINPEMHECKHCGGRTNVSVNDVWSDDFCSKACAEGREPTCRDRGYECDWKLEEAKYDQYHSQDMESAQFAVELRCSKCDNQLVGHLFEM